MSSLFTHRYIIRSLIFLLNISLETRLLGHVYFETWESAAVYQQSRSKSCRIYTSGMYITNSIWKENVCLMNNTHLSSAAMQVFWMVLKTFWLFFRFIMSNSGCTIYLCLLPVFCSVHSDVPICCISLAQWGVNVTLGYLWWKEAKGRSLTGTNEQ